jgi:hypothetical protein
MGYAINQRQALEGFLDDGRLPMSNNVSERNLEREALGRKNWLCVAPTTVLLPNGLRFAHRQLAITAIVA